MKLHLSKNGKTAAIVVGGGLILYLLYRYYQSSSAGSSANTAGQLTPVSTDPGTSSGSGGGTSDWTGSASGGTLDSDLQALMAQDALNNSNLLSAIGALTPPAPTTDSPAGAAAAAMVSGPLNALPIAAQIALVHAGLADPSQLGTKAKQVYSHGDSTLAQYATGQRQAPPRAPTFRTQAGSAGKTTGAQARSLGSQVAGYVNANHDPHKSGSAVAPSHHGPKPTVRPAPAPHVSVDHQTGGAKSAPASGKSKAQPRTVTPKPKPKPKAASKR